MSDFDDGMYEDDPLTTISMVDEDGKETEFIIISSVSDGGANYLLVSEKLRSFDSEAEATILKEVREEGDDSIFVVVDTDEEFLKAVALFKNSHDDYDIEI